MIDCENADKSVGLGLVRIIGPTSFDFQTGYLDLSKIWVKGPIYSATIVL